jgi:hypothetical protein
MRSLESTEVILEVIDENDEWVEAHINVEFIVLSDKGDYYNPSYYGIDDWFVYEKVQVYSFDAVKSMTYETFIETYKSGCKDSIEDRILDILYNINLED